MRRLKQLDEENSQADEAGRRSVARQGDAAGRDPPKAVQPGRRGKLVDEVRNEWQVSIRRACAALEFDRLTYHYKSRGSNRRQASLKGPQSYAYYRQD